MKRCEEVRYMEINPSIPLRPIKPGRAAYSEIAIVPKL